MRVFYRNTLIFIVVLAVTMLSAVALAAWATEPNVAAADPAYELTLYDGNMPCTEGAVENLYCYRADYTNMVRRYTFTYHKGIDLRLGATTTTGESISWQPAEMMQSVKRDDNGDVTDYTVSGSIGDTFYTFKIRIVEKTLNVAWQEESLSCEYGEAIAPKVTLSGTNTDVDTLRNLENNVTYLAKNGSIFDTAYVKDIGKGDYEIKPVLAEKGNYTLADTSASYHVGQFSGTIVVAKETEAVVYNGAARSSIDLLGATVEKGGVAVDGYTIAAQYSLDGVGVESNTATLSTVGTFYVAFSFEGLSSNYVNYRSPASGWYTITIDKADVAMNEVQSPLSVEYNKDRTAESAANELYGMRGDFYEVKDTAGNKIQCAPIDFTFSYRAANAVEWSDVPPDTVGDYQVRIHFNGNGYYNATAAKDDLLLPLEIRKCEVWLSWKEYQTLLQYGERFDLSELYQVDSVAFNAWIEEGNQAEYYLTYEMSTDLSKWTPYVPDESLPMPAYYHATVVMDSALYCGRTRAPASIFIEKVALTAENVALGDTTFTYGDAVSLTPVVGQNIEIDGTWRVEFRQGGEQTTIKNVGAYDVYLTLDEDSMYRCELSFEGANGVTIAPRGVDLTVWNYDVVYGESAFESGIRYGDDGAALVWWPYGSVLTGDANDFLQHLGVTVQAPNGQWVSQIDKTFVCTDTGYAIKITSTNINYAVTVKREGKLYVNPRPLHVSVTGNNSIFEGATPKFEITVPYENHMSDAEFEQINAALSLAYRDSEGKSVDGIPTEVGTYTVELVKEETGVLVNYRVQCAPVKLTIKALTHATSDADFEVSGKFNTTDTLMVEKGVNSRYSAAVANLSGYHVVTVYEVVNPIAAESGLITFRLAASSDLRNAKLLYLEGDQWLELDYTREGEDIVFSQRIMATKYVIAAQREINWMLIGLIAGGVVLAVIAVVIGATIPQIKRKKKLADQATKQVAAPTAASGAKPDEDEELDSFIEAFDESTVERELTPAERIALREKEEKYQQYKARLARMRTSDRTLTDTLSGLGLEKNADEDEIIARMIEADEARARQVEEDLKREQEEAKAKAEEENKAIILERSDEVLEQKTFAPTIPDSDDDDDIDI